MKGVWIDANNDPDYAKLAAAGIDAAYFDIRDPRLTLAYLNDVRKRAGGVGVYAAWNWQPALTGPQFADWLNARLETIAAGAGPDFPMVCADIEIHDVGYILGFLKRWRQHRPARTTDLTLEGYQGGLYRKLQALEVCRNVRFVAPQFYRGGMQAQRPGVTQDLIVAGFMPGQIVGMYDAAVLPSLWRGYAFTQGRLP